MLSLLALQILQRRPDPSPLTGTDSQQENRQLLMCERSRSERSAFQL